MRDELLPEFLNPPAAWRGKPFWSWNGDLHEEELLRQVEVMQEMGLGGFFMHSRTGLITEYLGEEWFRLTNVCVDDAEKRGLEAWLYDEDRWPSGTAGGMATEDPAFRSKFMCLETVPGSQFVWHNGLTAAFSCRLEGAAFYECTRLFSDTDPDSYRDKVVLAFHVEDSNPSTFFNGNTYADTLNREATEHYIQLTHEQYRKHCGRRLGTSIQGIFTDEPHRGPVFNGFTLSAPNMLSMTPWTEALPGRFAAQFGADIVDKLPTLFLLPEGRTVSPVKWQYMETLQQMFLDNFAKPLYDWCDTNNMLLTGHVLHEDSLTAQTAMQGSLMRFYEYMHVPGVDVLTEGTRHFPIVKQLSSAARQLGQKWLLSELYGCTGWQMSFEDHKRSGDWQALFGINLRCHHLSWYTMQGEAKRDYPGSILHQSAWYKDYGYVETYFARLGLLLAQGKPCCDILVLNPVESLWCQIHVGWAEGLSPKTCEVEQLESAYTELSSCLLGAHLDFDYGDEDMLGRLGRVEAGEEGPVLKVGQAQYRVVVAGRMTTMRSSTLRLLSEFTAAGGTVIFAGSPPEYVDSLPSAAPEDLAAQAVHLPWDNLRGVAAACREQVRNDVQITDADTGVLLHQIACQMRVDGDRRILVAMNMSEDESVKAARIALRLGSAVAASPDESFVVEEWDCRTGARYRVPCVTSASEILFSTGFSPSGERVFVVARGNGSLLAERPSVSEAVQQAAPGPFEFALGEENVCVLDFARHKLGGGEWRESLEILKVDRAVRAALGLPLRSGEMVQPWFSRKNEAPPQALTDLLLKFEFDAEAVPEGPIFLCLEQPERWRITLNGQPVLSEAKGWWVDKAFQKIALTPGAFATGNNVLTLSTDFSRDTNLEAVYLVGSFGVRLAGSAATLTRLPDLLMPTNLVEQGLPFYGGAVTYFVPVPAGAWPLSVTLPDFEAACVKVLSPQGAAALIAWPPYRAEVPPRGAEDGCVALEVVLTRRNTFGPLHQVPLRASGYGPDNFITEGTGYTEDYQLYPAGLLQPPIFSWQENPGNAGT